MSNTTATTTFTRAIKVRDDGGFLAIIGHEGTFADWTTDEYDGTAYDWDVIGELKGWGKWTHLVRVATPMGPRTIFAR